MIIREYPTILQAYLGMTDELAYGTAVNGNAICDPIKWGVCIGYPDIACIDIEDILADEDLHLGMASYTKSRWTRFMRRYFREDLYEWLKNASRKLMKYPSRPFVASYSLNVNLDDEEARAGHNYGGCLSSLQIRVKPDPRVILYSRACHIDKVGFLDLSLIHVIGREMKALLGKDWPVKGTWVVSNGFVSAISQIYYVQRFNKPYKGNRLERVMGRIAEVDYEDIKFGPLKRGRARMAALAEFGEIPRSIWVKDLSIQRGVFIK